MVGMVEEVARGEGQAARARSGDDLDALHRVATQFEEVVVDPEQRRVQHLAPCLGQRALGVGARRHPNGGDRRPLRRELRKRCTIDLAAGRQRQVLQSHERRGDDLSRKRPLQEAAEFGLRDLGARRVEGDEPRLQRRRTWVIADPPQHVANLGRLELVVQFGDRRVAFLVAEPHIPAVRHCVVVKATLGRVHVDPGLVDQAVGRSPGVGRPDPRRARAPHVRGSRRARHRSTGRNRRTACGRAPRPSRTVRTSISRATTSSIRW